MESQNGYYKLENGNMKMEYEKLENEIGIWKISIWKIGIWKIGIWIIGI